ncbi:YqjF family protein [Auraticoccus monumenti]|uniref:DUF2071 domain-containing protein n=1 Tax=Auraticoccus monumenti TaxID=675864 RepID=A0A1G6ZDS0_9ACTN|nr:DUF2071 domain-containing protein [Auraticoccus monumenti]SDE00701.1 hypothetical protein SAMN04489747_2261 [Auraticoccus monumenti]
MPPSPLHPISAQAPPLAGRALLAQRWEHLFFVHWRVDPDLVAPLLPPGTRPDVVDGASWVGLIPFRLTRARVGPSPALPWVGSFAETNVRLYAVDDSGRRGVVFASLEAERLAFVLGARLVLGLPYTWARMTIRTDGDRWEFESRRRWPGPGHPRTRLVLRTTPEPVVDDPTTTFLTARWGLHTSHLGRTLWLPNEHEPWALRRAELLELDDELVAAAGLPGLTERAPDSVLYSPGVSTRFGLAGPGTSGPPASTA